MAEANGERPDVGQMIESLVLAMNRQARSKPHPVLYVSSALVLTLLLAVVQGALSYGDLRTRVGVLEGKTHGIESLQTKVDSLKEDFRRFVERYERLQDEQQRPRR
ncbi:MAG: hypothetical protein K0Q71_2143 [Thermomicrobiales bacterium]|jgi:hypothetical protein|nr:hypothetical protein [Thermomicrobiales bacterium]